MGLFLDESVGETEVLNELTIKNFAKRVITFKGIRNFVRLFQGDTSGFVEDWKEDIDDEVVDEASRQKFLKMFEDGKKSFQQTADGKNPLATKLDEENCKKFVKNMDELIAYTKSKKFPPKK
jgi:hypothetical protein